MIQKSVLVGCREGSWVPCSGLRNPSLRVSAKDTTRLRVQFKPISAPDSEMILDGTGDHQIPATGGFLKVNVVDGFCPDNVLVQLRGEHAL